MNKKMTITKSSGNVFKDLGYPDLEAEEMLAKAELASQINKIIHARKLTQKEAAKILEISQPNVSLLNKGILKDFSITRLMRFLSRLNQDIDIVLRSKPSKKNNFPGLLGHLQVICA
jgi:predicted XRE-type DNA-binding protein